MRALKIPTDIKARIRTLTISAGILLFIVLSLSSCGISLRSSLPDPDSHSAKHGISETQIEPAERSNPMKRRHDTPDEHGGKKMFRRSSPSIPDKPSRPTVAPGHEVFTDHIRNTREGADEWIKLYNDTYGDGSASGTIMTHSEIADMNRRMTEECHGMRDMASVPETISGDELLHMIRKYELPHSDFYTSDHTLIDGAIRSKILENRNLDQIKDTVELRRAIIVKRCNIKSFPTDIGFYKYKDLEHCYYDNIQETELIVGFPVAVASESLDGQFLFVISYYYSGWIPADAAAYCSNDIFEKFVRPELYVTIVEKKADCGNHAELLDMGTVLPYVSEDFDSYTVLLPTRLDDGSLELTDEKVSKSDAVFGSLEFTQANFINQAFAFIGSDYDWGGGRGGVDCSGFTCAVFRSFGIYLPRNAGQQRDFAGNVTQFNEESNISGALDSAKYPTSVYRPGHVMLYLGKKDGEYYIIHAPQGGEQVTTAALPLWNLTGISSFSAEQ